MEKIDIGGLEEFPTLFYSRGVEAPHIQGYEMGPMLGAGTTGAVFEAKRADGKVCAVKVFESMASNVNLLANRIARVHESALSGVTVPILGQTLDARPACVVMPVIEGNLQLRLADYFGKEDAWTLIQQLADGLAKLHASRVAHGNLKPGNVFFGDNGEALLADYATGLMPGVHRMSYSDAILYAPPEQLRHPDGYLNEAGYRWDVYAFGVLAFRLLNGIFPRCEELFKDVSPEPGTKQRFNIEADYQGIANGLEAAPLAKWKHEAADEGQVRRRHIIEHCLAIHPLERPSNMMEVQRRLAVVANDLNREAEKALIIRSERRAHLFRKFMTGTAVVLAITALVFFGLWKWTQARRDSEAAVATTEYLELEEAKDVIIAGLENQVRQSHDLENRALESEKKTQIALENEQAKSRGELVFAQITNEQLFRWILEKGITGLPTLEGRQGRLAALEQLIHKQLEGLENRAGLEEQCAVLRLRLAEVILASGRTDMGEKALEDALKLGGDDLANQDVARARLRWLLLQSTDAKQDLKEGIKLTEAAIDNAWPKGSDKRLRARAALHLVKGRQADYLRDSKTALTQYYKSLQLYQQLSREYPESPALYFTLGRVYLSAGQVAEGAGAVDDAATLRGYAAKHFLKLAQVQGKKTPEIEYQIASATAVQAVSEWQQGKTFEAEKLAAKGLGKLSTLVVKMPNDFRVVVDLASQQGIIATALRDEGKSRQAAKLLKQAMTRLETGLEQHPDDLKARYLLASLQWQMCGLLGQQGAGEEEIELGTRARDGLYAILAAKKPVPHPYLVRKSLAYLCGDLGHAADLHGDRPLAVKLLREAAGHWKELLKLRPDSPENKEGFRWVRQMLVDLGAG